MSRALTIFTSLGNDPWRARALRALAAIAETDGDSDRARLLRQESEVVAARFD